MQEPATIRARFDPTLSDADRHAEAVVIGDGGLEEGDRALRLLVRHDHGEGDARGVVDADMDELPAGAFTSGPCVALPPAVAGDAVADLVEAAELLDVDVDELAGVLAFVAPHRLGRLEVPEAAQAGALEDAADRGGRDPGGLGDVLAREAPAAQRDHLIDDGGARRLSQALRA